MSNLVSTKKRTSKTNAKALVAEMLSCLKNVIRFKKQLLPTNANLAPGFFLQVF